MIFSNSQSTTLFEYDFTEPYEPENKVLEIQSPIDMPRFLELESKPLKNIGDLESLIGVQPCVTDPRLLSLKDILLKPDLEKEDENGEMKVESYLMKKSEFLVDQDSDNTKTIIVKRMKLNFNEVESRVINFTDITSYIRLKHEEEVNNLLKTLNTSVHHEMVVPLKVNIDMAERLKSKLQKIP